EIAARKFTIAPDRLARSHRTPTIELVRGRRDLGDALAAIDIGKRSNHTDEYLLFYLPRAKLPYEGDLGWLTRPRRPLRARSRAAGILQTIDEQHLDVDRLVQSWPVAGNTGEVSLVQLRALVAARAQGK